MRAEEFLIESEGGMARRAEETARNPNKPVSFKNAQNNIITIIGAQAFPPTGDKTDSYDELYPQILQYTKNNNVSKANTLSLPPNSKEGFTTPEKAGAALVMIFKDNATNKNIAWVAFKASKKLGAYPIFVKTKAFTDLTGYAQLSNKPGEENKISGIQERAITNLKPVGIMPTNVEIRVDDIPTQVQTTLATRNDLSNDIKQQVVQLLQAVALGSSNPVPGAGNSAKSYEIDLGETAAPIALFKKKFLSGDWQQAEAGMNLRFDRARGVEFPNDPAEKLYDSYLKFGTAKNPIILRISSKDKGGGAKASVSGVVDDITNYPDRYTGLFDTKTNPGFNDLLEIIKIIKDPDMNYVSSSKRWRRNGSIAGALQLGVFTGIIDTNQAARILDIIDTDETHLGNNALGNDLFALLKYKRTNDSNRPDYRIGWHLLAAVAAGVEDKVNKNYRTTDFFKAVLERSNMIQIKTSLTQKSVNDAKGKKTNGAYFSNFEVIYPPVFSGIITLASGSNYYATRKPVGKMGFYIDDRKKRVKK